MKDAQGALRHASIQTKGDVYMQAIEASVLNAMNSRTKQIFAGWEHPVTTLSMDCSTHTASSPPE
ncbi:MAG: hypothetical protein ABSG62_07515 [Terracidiphilus sp.]